MTRILFVCIALGLSSVFAGFGNFDSQPDASGYKFLKLQLDPTSLSMGGVGAALSSSALRATESNPASAAGAPKALYMGFGYPHLESSARTSHITWGFNILGQYGFFHSRFLGYDDIPGYTSLNESTGSYSSHTISAKLGLAGAVNKFKWGMALSFVEQNIEAFNYHTFLADAGVQYEPLQGLWLGAAMTHLNIWSSKAHVGGNTAPFPPTTARAGVSYTRVIKGPFKGTLSLDGRTRNDEELNYPVGGELIWRDIISLRLGYPVLERGAAVSPGMGIKWRSISFDYNLHRHDVLSPGHYFQLKVLY
jgi:hypothetical protein